MRVDHAIAIGDDSLKEDKKRLVEAKLEMRGPQVLLDVVFELEELKDRL